MTQIYVIILTDKTSRKKTLLPTSAFMQVELDKQTSANCSYYLQFYNIIRQWLQAEHYNNILPAAISGRFRQPFPEAPSR